MVEYGQAIRSGRELPYVAPGVELHGRAIPVVPYFDCATDEWFGFLQIPGKGLTRMQMHGVVEGLLLASRPLDSEADLCIPLANFVFQHMSFKGVLRSLNGVLDVLENLASTLELYEHISRLYAEELPGASQLSQTLVNWLMVTSRTYFEVLHELFRRACLIIKHRENTSRPLMYKLPERVSRVMLDDGKPRDPADLVRKYKMPSPLAEYYCKQAPLLAMVRKVRDNLVHRGRNVGDPGSHVFCLEHGLAVGVDREPWCSMPIWDETLIVRERLGPLRLVFAHVISEIMRSGTELVAAFSSCIGVPPPISPGNYLFLRNPLNRHLHSLEEMLGSPWERQE